MGTTRRPPHGGRIISRVYRTIAVAAMCRSRRCARQDEPLMVVHGARCVEPGWPPARPSIARPARYPADAVVQAAGRCRRRCGRQRRGRQRRNRPWRPPVAVAVTDPRPARAEPRCTRCPVAGAVRVRLHLQRPLAASQSPFTHVQSGARLYGRAPYAGRWWCRRRRGRQRRDRPRRPASCHCRRRPSRRPGLNRGAGAAGRRWWRLVAVFIRLPPDPGGSQLPLPSQTHVGAGLNRGAGAAGRRGRCRCVWRRRGCSTPTSTRRYWIPVAANCHSSTPNPHLAESSDTCRGRSALAVAVAVACLLRMVVAGGGGGGGGGVPPPPPEKAAKLVIPPNCPSGPPL